MPHIMRTPDFHCSRQTRLRAFPIRLTMTKTMKNKSFDTLAVHGGEERDLHYGALSTPIYPASVFAFSDPDEGIAIHNFEKPGYFYGRLGNPTQTALERCIAELEAGEDALSFASGMA